MPANTWVPKGAAAKLAYIQTQIDEVDKAGHNQHFHFDYFKEHSIFELLRPAMRKLHCALIVSPAAVSVTMEEKQTAKGKPMQVVTLVGDIIFIDTDEPADSPDRAVVGRYCAGGADDVGDKAYAKAETIFTKYGLQKLFLIPTEDIEDGDADGEPEPEPEPKPKARKRAPRKAKVTSADEQTDGEPVDEPDPSGDDVVAAAKDKLDAEEAPSLDELGDLYDEAGWTEDDLRIALIGIPEVDDVDDIGAAMSNLTGPQRLVLGDFLRAAIKAA